MNENELRHTIGQYLKNIRKKSNLSASLVASRCGYTQGHVSGIENGTKTVPTDKFITRYLEALQVSDIIYNQYVDELKELTDGSINLAKKNINNRYINESLPNTLVNNIDENIEINEFKVPINDLYFHLNDKYNSKFFNGIKLDDNEKQYIFDFIKNYLKQKENIRFNEIKDIQSQIEFNIKENKNLNDLSKDIQAFTVSTLNNKTKLEELNLE